MKTKRPVFVEDYRVNDRIKAFSDVLDEDGDIVMRRGECGTVRTSMVSQGGKRLLYVATDDGREVRIRLPALIRRVRLSKTYVRDLFRRRA